MISTVPQISADSHPAWCDAAAVCGLLKQWTEQPFWSMTSHDLYGLIAELQRAADLLGSLTLSLLDEADSRGLAKTYGAPSTTALMKGALRLTKAVEADVKLAKALQSSQFDATRAALAHGRIHVDQARAVVDSVESLPRELAPDLRAEAERRLLDDCRTQSATQIRQNGRTVLDELDHDLADEKLGEQVRKDEKRAERDRCFTKRDLGDGRCRVSGVFPERVSQMFDTVLDPMAAPRPTDAHSPDTRSPGQRRADAIEELLRRQLQHPDLGTHGGNNTTVILTIDGHNLFPHASGRGDSGPAPTDRNGGGEPCNRQKAAGFGRYLRNGAPTTLEHIQQAICDGRMAVVWFGTNHEDIAHSKDIRLFTGPQRRTLQVRDGGCAFPGCDRPPSWCEAHHIVPWSRGGPTTIANGVLLCGHHHRLIHQGEWQVRMGGDAKPEFIPPDYVDPRRQPLRNHMHHRA